jgi:hypothetical protein|uniref:Uncharacterized protein n=1 Tax=viral metagenome TaxID=1070528 RepID=A0A6C0CZF0_9ZZZZ
MNNLVLITSIINTPNIPLSYTNIRSTYTPDERYEQLKRTINSVREKIPNIEIFLVECSDLTDIQFDYLTKNTNYFLNLYDNESARVNIYSISKSLGENTMIYYALQKILLNDIVFDNLIKISGRYWLSNNFNYDFFNNNKIVIKYIEKDSNNVLTALYKLPKNLLHKYMLYLGNNFDKMKECIGCEVLFAHFIKSIQNDYDILIIDPIGLTGFVSVDTNNLCNC